MNRQRLVLVLLLCLCAVTGCDVKSVDPVVKIGVVAPFDGELQHIGYDLLYSVRLAVREVNEAGGINGHRVALVIYSDSSDPVRAIEVRDTLLVDPNVVAVLGHWYPDTTIIAQPGYSDGGLAFVPMGEGAFGPTDPSLLPETFRQAYNAIAFEANRQPTEWAGTAYDGMQLVFEAMTYAGRVHGTVDRATVFEAISRVSADGLTGELTLTP